jgi:uncharacterized protein DUF4193
MRSCQGGNPQFLPRTGRHDPQMPDDIEDLAEEEEELAADEDDEAEPTAEDLEDATVPPEPGLENVESIQDLLAKQEATETVKEAADEDEEVIPLDLAKDDRAEAIDTKVVPMQETEFMCRNCFLVKHRSQLADKKKMLCRDCA